ncbi:MAG: DUF2207 domain-containing protein [Leptolyngbya sp. RL_3_1]|nr:DUF2207 domain-containing protein [Leptolyngbya sp. RL_3_1]
MYPRGSNNVQLNFSGLGCWLTLFGMIWLLGAVGLGWLVKSIAVLTGLVIIAPVIGFLGFRWWLGRNLVEGACPVCQNPMTGLNNLQTQCLNCGTPLQGTRDGFKRATQAGTVEVSAVEIDEDGASKTVTVEVLPPLDDPN